MRAEWLGLGRAERLVLSFAELANTPPVHPDGEHDQPAEEERTDEDGKAGCGGRLALQGRVLVERRDERVVAHHAIVRDETQEVRSEPLVEFQSAHGHLEWKDEVEHDDGDRERTRQRPSQRWRRGCSRRLLCCRRRRRQGRDQKAVAAHGEEQKYREEHEHEYPHCIGPRAMEGMSRMRTCGSLVNGIERREIVNGCQRHILRDRSKRKAGRVREKCRVRRRQSGD